MGHSGECFDQEMKRSTRDLHEHLEKSAQLVLHVYLQPAGSFYITVRILASHGQMHAPKMILLSYSK